MFLKYIKGLIIKKTLKNSLQDVQVKVFSTPIKTVGLFIDETYFFDKQSLIDRIIENGIAVDNLKIIAYREVFKKDDEYLQPTFGLKDFSFKGQIKQGKINDFVNEEFDLLINYYDIEKPIMLLLSNNSKAKFKVGFSSVDKRLNHLMINSTVEDHNVFTHELFRYLKILNKL